MTSFMFSTMPTTVPTDSDTLSANDEGVHLVSDMQAGEENEGGVAGADQGLCSV